ncbi:oxidoreductase [Filimonas lacunae]|nr:oxidoreductase [Filimonas lacunae]
MPQQIPPQYQVKQPGTEQQMHPSPVYDTDEPGCNRLQGKAAIITGGDSGIGKAVAIAFAKEGANVAIVYLDEHTDARETGEIIKNKYGKQVLLISTDLRKEVNAQDVVARTVEAFGTIDIVVNNAAVQFPQESIEQITAEQLETTFATNIFSQFYLTKHAVPYLKEGSTIINTTSVTAYRGSEALLDYSSTKGAIVSFTRSLSQQLIKKGIRVNGVAPGPVWTPLIPSSFDEEKVASFGQDIAMGRPAQPVEIAPCYVFLACKESTFINGQVLHPNGGTVLNT